MADPTEPKPLGVSRIQSKDGWPISSTLVVPQFEESDVAFFDVFLGRRTIRSCIPARLPRVLSLIRYVMMPRQTGDGENLGRMRKVTVSAGALHPVEVLVIAGPEVVEPIIYLDCHDTFGTVAIDSREQAMIVLSDILEIVPDAQGHLILFVANQRHAAQAYDHPQSLIWRDAGALLQTFSLLASASDLSFIPLGATGRSILDALPVPHPDYVAVGMAIIGEMANPAGGVAA